MGPSFPRLYGTGAGADVRIPLLKRAVVDFAVGADYTPSAGDCKVSKDGGAAANISTLPTALAMGNTALWVFVFSDAELQCKELQVTLADAATKAVEDQMFSVVTYGHASAMFVQNLSTTMTQTGDSFARLGTPVGASLSVDVAGVQADTNDLQNRVPAALVSGRIDASVGAMATDVVTSAAIATDAIGANELAASAITEIQSGLSTYAGGDTAGTSTLLARVPGTVQPQTGDTYALANGASGFVALKAAVDAIVMTIGVAGAGLTAIASAVWSATTRLLSAGTNIVLEKGTGLTGLNDLDAAAVRTAVGLASANLDTQLGEIQAKTSLIPADPADASDIAGAFFTVNTTLGILAGYLDTEVNTILAKVNALPTDPADASDITAAVAALSATLTLIKAKTDALTFTIPAVLDTNVERINDVVILGNGSTVPFGV